MIKKLRRYVAFLLVLSMTLNCLPVNAIAAQIDDISIAEVTAEITTMSENRMLYESLLNGNYSNGDLPSKFRELFGYDYSDEYVRANYRSIFDLADDEEIDEAFLNVITNYVEDFSLQTGQSRVTSRSIIIGQDEYSVEPPEVEERPTISDLVPEIIEYNNADTEVDDVDATDDNGTDDDDNASFEEDAGNERDVNEIVTENEITDTNSDEITAVEDDVADTFEEAVVEESGIELNVDNNAETFTQDETAMARSARLATNLTSDGDSYAYISLVSKTETSITMRITFASGDEGNNYLAMYETGWVYLYGQGNGTITSRTYTATGLKPGVVYTFRVGKYDWNTKSWHTGQIRIQTNGAKTQSLELVSKTTTSITVKAQFPVEGIWGNRILFGNKFDWVNIGSGTDYYKSSGTYTVSNLAPGASYGFYLQSYDDFNSTWNEAIYLDIATDTPSENLQTYSKSNIDFSLDTSFTDYLGSSMTQRFLNETNEGFNTMYRLVNGDTTYSGGKMALKQDRTLPDGVEGRSGWPIRWDYEGAIEHAIKMKYFDTPNTETPFHEISHNFDNYKWSFEAEALAILKIYYHYSTSNQSMALSNQSMIFTGTDYKTYMKSYASRISGHINYDKAMANGVYSPYSLAYNLGDIADQIGWDAFTKTFTYFYNLPAAQVPSDKLGKFNLFLSKLQDFSGRDVFSMFTSSEKAIYEAYFGGTLEYMDLSEFDEWEGNLVQYNEDTFEFILEKYLSSNSYSVTADSFSVDSYYSDVVVNDSNNSELYAMYEELSPEAKNIYQYYALNYSEGAREILEDNDALDSNVSASELNSDAKNSSSYDMDSQASPNLTSLSSTVAVAAANTLYTFEQALYGYGLNSDVVNAFVIQLTSILAAVADGPLPIGDIVALLAGVFTGYIVYKNWDAISSNWDNIVGAFTTALSGSYTSENVSTMFSGYRFTFEELALYQAQVALTMPKTFEPSATKHVALSTTKTIMSDGTLEGIYGSTGVDPRGISNGAEYERLLLFVYRMDINSTLTGQYNPTFKVETNSGSFNVSQQQRSLAGARIFILMDKYRGKIFHVHLRLISNDTEQMRYANRLDIHIYPGCYIQKKYWYTDMNAIFTGTQTK